jgi:hypothetical protein
VVPTRFHPSMAVEKRKQVRGGVNLYVCERKGIVSREFAFNPSIYLQRQNECNIFSEVKTLHNNH